FLNVDIQKRFHWVKHHVAHAASAFFMSGFRESAIVVADGIAENASTMIAKANDTKIIVLDEIHYPHSLGFLWEKLSEFMGFTSFDAAKVMGLAAYGDEGFFSRAFNSLAWINKQGFQVDRLLAQFRQPEFSNMAKLFGPERRQSEEISKRHCDLAASLQKFTNEAILTLSKKAFDMFPQKNLCLTGGLALNCTSNQFIKEHGPVDNLYIPSAPHDSGTAAGAALALYYNFNGRSKTSDNNLIDPYFGPDFSDEEIKYECAQHDLDAEYTEKPWEEAAILISQGKIIGWFQDRMEFGPRALGNRSILADPRSIHTRERLNKEIKHRENFRPFAPSVLGEAANEWFLLGRPSKSFRYMIFACPVRQDKTKLIPAVVHVDSSSRVQLVTHEDNPKFYNLIKFFYEKTGIPLVLNTSFNVSEPIVCTPQDALRTFKNSELDALVIGNYVLIRDS
ncbi:MAG: hypothetical protein MUP22_05045, partial [Desulfobacterales bacterium]|nr:hypothetical protein [Desulfobacterales bacterium]